MNTPSPLVPQGSTLEQKSKSQSRVKAAFLCVIGVHVAVFSVVLLVQGCKREAKVDPIAETSFPAETNLGALDPNYTPFVASNTVPATSAPPVFVEQQPVQNVPPIEVAAPIPATTEYVIVQGDTLTGIAKKMGVTLTALQAANPGLEPTRLRIGQKIVIPAATATTPTTGETTAPAGGEQTYAVKSGDTLSAIARKYNTTVAALRAANGLTTDRITVGQKLKIPAQ